MAQIASAFSQPGLLVRLSEMLNGNRTCQPGKATPQPLSEHTVNKFRRLAVLQLNVEGLMASKMNIVHHLAVQYEELVILLQETHCTCADKPIIPGFTPAGSSLSRKHGLANFVHDRLKWTIVDQSPATSETEWLCMDVDGYRIVMVYKSPPTRLQASDL